MLGPLRKDDDRWLFIPAIKLVTRIAAKDNQSSFVGSDFTYEDVSGRDLGADAYELLREEATAGRDCYVAASNPKAASAFSRKVSWIDKTSFLPVKEEYYVPVVDTIAGRGTARGVQNFGANSGSQSLAGMASRKL